MQILMEAWTFLQPYLQDVESSKENLEKFNDI